MKSRRGLMERRESETQPKAASWVHTVVRILHLSQVDQTWWLCPNIHAE